MTSTYHPFSEFQGSENWSSRIIHPGPDLSLFLQAGTGAIPRRLHEKVGSILSPADFGAVGDGVANDQAAFDLLEAAFPTSRPVDLEGLTYLVTTLPTGHNYRYGTFKVGSTLYQVDLVRAPDLTDDSAELQAITTKLAGTGKAGFLSGNSADLQAITDKLAGTGKAAFLSSNSADLQAITTKLAGTGKAGFLSSVTADLQAITDKLAGTGKAAFLSDTSSDLQAVTDKLAGTGKAAFLSSVTADLQAITDKLVGTGKAAFLSNTSSDLQAITDKLAGTGKAGFLSSTSSDLQAVTDKLAGTGKAAFLSSVSADLQAITDKLAGTVKAATLSSVAGDLQAITDKLVGTGKAAFLSSTAADLQAVTNKLQVLQSDTGAIARTVTHKLRDWVSVKDFGAVGDGVANDTAAFTAALAACDVVIVPEGTYNHTGIAISRDGAKLLGMGRGASILNCTNASTAAVTVNGYLADVSIIGLTISRSVIATSGGYGIRWVESASRGLVRNCRVTAHHVGISLCSTDFSTVDDVIVDGCVTTGVYMTNNSSNGALQWSLNNVLSSGNGYQGFLVQATLGPAAVALGTWTGIATYANGGVGVGVVGLVGCPVHGLRMYNSFLGEDANHEVYLDTYGRLHKIAHCLIELSGMPTSNTGSGIEITANNTEVQVTGCTLSNNALHGIRISGGVVQVTGCSIHDNGRALSVFERFGIYVGTAGRAILNGNSIGNSGSGTHQQYGIGFALDNTHIVNGNDLTGNVTQGLYTGVPVPSAAVTGNIPLSINVY